MAAARPTVAAVVVGAGNRRWLGPALESLLRSAGQGTHFDLEVFYVDNKSPDDSVPYVRTSFPEVHVIANEANIGFAAANNLAMRQALDAGVDYLFLVNPDTWTPHDLVWHLAHFMENWPGYGIVGPIQWQYSLGTELVPLNNAWTETALAAGDQHALAINRRSLSPPADPGTPRAPRSLEHAYVQGAAFFARADLLRKIGLFDEVYHSFYEETDLCRRARLAGWRVALLLDLGIHHHGGGNSGGSRYRRLQMMRNKFYYLLTDIDLTWLDMLEIALGWARRDLVGDGVGGRSTIAEAWADFARSTTWLCGQLPTVRRRRRGQAVLRASAEARPPQ